MYLGKQRHMLNLFLLRISYAIAIVIPPLLDLALIFTEKFGGKFGGNLWDYLDPPNKRKENVGENFGAFFVRNS